RSQFLFILCTVGHEVSNLFVEICKRRVLVLKVIQVDLQIGWSRILQFSKRLELLLCCIAGGPSSVQDVSPGIDEQATVVDRSFVVVAASFSMAFEDFVHILNRGYS
ncbi:hypothetical protein MTO96_034141, partial [Rhipicephalus appendiculatus]